MHRVAVLAVPPATTFDLAIPELDFGAAQVNGAAAYEVRIGTPDPGLVEAYGTLQVTVPHGLEVVNGANTVIVTGTGARHNADPRVLAALRRAAAAGSRIASICTGAFVLAQAGLLEATGPPPTGRSRLNSPRVSLGWMSWGMCSSSTTDQCSPRPA